MAKTFNTVDKININGIDYQIGQRNLGQGTLEQIILAAIEDNSFDREIAFATTLDYGVIALFGMGIVFSGATLSSANFNFINSNGLYSVTYTGPGTLNVTKIGESIENLIGSSYVNLDQNLYNHIYNRNLNGDRRAFQMEVENIANWIGNAEQVEPEGGAFGWFDDFSDDIVIVANGGIYALNDEYKTRPIVNYNTLAERVIYDNSNSGLTSTNVQEALDEINEKFGEIVENNVVDKTNVIVTESSKIVPISAKPKPNTTYRVFWNTAPSEDTAWGRLLAYDKDGYEISPALYFFSLYAKGGVFTTPNDIDSWKFDLRINDLVITPSFDFDFTIVEGEEEPYNRLNPNIVLANKTVSPAKTTFIENNLIFGKDNFHLTANAPSVEIFNEMVDLSDECKNITVYINNLTTPVFYGLEIGLSFKDISGVGIGTITFVVDSSIDTWKLRREGVPEGAKKVEVFIKFVKYDEDVSSYEANIDSVRIYNGNEAPLTLENDLKETFDFKKYYRVPVFELFGTTFEMTKDNEKNMTWRFKGKSGNCTVKWQGSSSIAYPKKNYTVKLSEKFDFGFGNQKKYCLKANWVDKTHCKNIISARLYAECLTATPDFATKYPLLDSAPNKGAVDGYPIVVTINGQYQGIYTFNIPKDGWMMNMGNGTNEAIICANAGEAGAIFQRVPQVGVDFDLEYATDEDNIAWINNDLLAIYNAIQNNDEATLRNLVDFENVLTYRAFCFALGNWDGIENNYMLAKFDNSKWFIMAYDLDSTFGVVAKDFNLTPSPTTSRTGNSLFDKVFDLTPAQDVNAINDRLYEIPLRPQNVCDKINKFARDIPLPLINKEMEFWTMMENTCTDTIDRMNLFYINRFPLMKEWAKKE